MGIIVVDKNKNNERQQVIERYKYQTGMSKELKGDSALDNYIRAKEEMLNSRKEIQFEEDQLKELIENTIERLLAQLKL